MRTIVLALATAALVSACASGARSSPATEQAGRAAPEGAAFMGYHGPAWRTNTPAD
jgi:uncharacterized protein YceK